MAKFSRTSRLSTKERQKLMVDFCDCLSTLKNGEEAARFLADLLGPQEAEMLAKRLKIAEFLLQDKDYQSIRKELKVGFSTIARVNTWLNLSGEGFKMVLARKPKPKYKPASDEEKYDPFSWYSIKRRYSLHFWPQLLIEELLKQSDKNHQEKIFTILQSMGNKARVLRNLIRIYMKALGARGGFCLKPHPQSILYR